jgi:hypothetical protein
MALFILSQSSIHKVSPERAAAQLFRAETSSFYDEIRSRLAARMHCPRVERIH